MGKTIRAPSSPRSQERGMDELTAMIVDRISKLFRAAFDLSDRAVEQFADANYAEIFLRNAERVRKQLIAQIGDDKIDKLVRKQLEKVSKRSRKELGARIDAAIGLASNETTREAAIAPQIDALVAQTSEWIKKLRDDTLAIYTNNSLQAMSRGLSLEDVMAQYDDLVEQRANHARSVARTQIANYNSLSTKLRAKEAGITRAIWRTSKDARVRDSHRDRDGKEFDIDKGLYSRIDRLYLLPGIDYQCRCDYDLIIPDD